MQAESGASPIAGASRIAVSGAPENAEQRIAQLQRLIPELVAELSRLQAKGTAEDVGKANELMRAVTALWNEGQSLSAGVSADAGGGARGGTEQPSAAVPNAQYQWWGVCLSAQSAELSGSVPWTNVFPPPAPTGGCDESVGLPPTHGPCASAAPGAAAGALAAAADSAAAEDAEAANLGGEACAQSSCPLQRAEVITQRNGRKAASKKRAEPTKGAPRAGEATPKKRAKAKTAARKPGARAGKGGAGITKGAAVAGGAAKPDAARVRAWRLRGGIGVSWHEHKKRWEVQIWYGKMLHLGCFKTKEDAIACRLLGEDRIDAGCHPETGKYVPEAERPKPTMPYNNTHLLGKPAQKFSDAALGEHATDLAAKVDAGTLDIDQVAGVQLVNDRAKWRARMSHKKKQCQVGSQTADLAEAIRYRLLAEKAIALFPDKNPKDYVAAAGKKRKR